MRKTSGDLEGARESEVQKEFEQAFEESYAEPWKGAGLLGSYLSSPDEIRRSFLEMWPGIGKVLEEPTSPEQALASIRDLVMYDIPDGTRSTLTVHKNMDVEMDAGMWCLSLIHALRSLGAQKVVLMTHTAYNRERGEADIKRIMSILEKGIAPLADYASSNRVRVDLVGMCDEYELSESLRLAFPGVNDSTFDVSFLIDYREEFFLEEKGRELLARLPGIDVVVRHTKLHVSGGWLPTKTLRSTYLYSQNGTLYSNWTYDEQVALVAAALLAKELNRGETLTKTYTSVEEVKKRFQSRELNLSVREVLAREAPKKLFVMGSPWGLVQIRY